MSVTNQKVAVFELAEVEYHGVELPSGYKPYTFSGE